MKSRAVSIFEPSDLAVAAPWRALPRLRPWRASPVLARLGLLLLLLLLGLLALPRSAHSASLDLIEARQAENGRTVYVNAEAATAPALRPPTSAPVRSYSAAKNSASASSRREHEAAERRPGAAEIDTAIRETSARHGVDANLVRAVVKTESNFNPFAVSSKGAMGLMQLMPATARRLNVANPFDLQQNLEGGVRHLKSLLASYNGDLRLSLAAYNAGASAVARAHGVPGFAETLGYVRQITDLYRPPSALSSGSWGQAPPIRVFRDPRGVLTITND
jgi:soluble lytic murein transglycosylase-like protein